MKKYILSLDQGTSSSRAIIFDKQFRIISLAQQEFPQYYPEPGWVEHDPEEIWNSQLQVIFRALRTANISANEIEAIGITNQRETIVMWDKTTGKPVYNAIVWQDRRTAQFCDLLKSEGLDKFIKDTTGLVLDSYFSASKARWILMNVPEARIQATNGNLLFGTIDSWLVWKLTKGSVHVTDPSNASRTMLFDINELEWNQDLLNIFSIPESVLPEIKSSSEIYGYTHPDLFEGVQVHISGIAGDQQAALFGQNCLAPGQAKNTYGTGCFMLMNTGQRPVFSENGLLTTIAWQIENQVTYAVEGSVFTAGAAVKWLRDGLRIINTATETEDLANKVTSTEGVYVVPAFSGLGAPYWDMYARGIIIGLTQGTRREHIVRATLESIAYQTLDLVNLMENDTKIKLTDLKVDGGGTANNFLMQFQADILNTKVFRPENIESTATGAAMLAGLATGFWTWADLANTNKGYQTFVPKMEQEERNNLYKKWIKAVERSRAWTDSD